MELLADEVGSCKSAVLGWRMQNFEQGTLGNVKGGDRFSTVHYLRE